MFEDPTPNEAVGLCDCLPTPLFPKLGNPHQGLVLAYRWTRSGKLPSGVGYILFIPFRYIHHIPFIHCALV